MTNGVFCAKIDYMEDIKKNISNNLVILRKKSKMTQQELAKKINYSDKAVSRWEVGESLPDINVLLQLCELYGTDFDWLIHEHKAPPKINHIFYRNIKIITAFLISVSCFLIATVLYVYFFLFFGESYWLTFVWSVPVSSFIMIWLSIKWWNKFVTGIFLSILNWSLLTAIFLTLLPLNNVWAVFLLGIPFQAVIVLSLLIKKDR